MNASAALAGAVLLLAGCTVGPNYRRPDYPVPPAYRGQAPDAAVAARSLGDLGWWEIFQDETLRDLIDTALAENYDVRVAAARVLDARARLTITRSSQVPTVSADGSAAYNRTLGTPPPGTPRETFSSTATLDLSFEIDLWGRLRRATEAARAQLLATEEARHTVLRTLVSDVASAYFQLCELDLELQIARRTLAGRRDSLRLVTLREEGGVATLFEVRQAETLVTGAAQVIPDTERRIEQVENSIAVLLGRHPGPVRRGRALMQQIALPAVPAGLPSTLLERRPDIRQAEQLLVAANAEIGAARALFFPQITLTGFAGVNASLVDGTLFGPLGVFAATPSVTLPIFNAGRIRAGVESAEARQQAAGLLYQQTIQQAFREVADALVEHRKRQELRAHQESLVASLRDAVRVADIRYKGGVSQYLEVLDSESRLFTAELQLAQTQRDELLAIVQLYRALGGGWQR